MNKRDNFFLLLIVGSVFVIMMLIIFKNVIKDKPIEVIQEPNLELVSQPLVEKVVLQTATFNDGKQNQKSSGTVNIARDGGKIILEFEDDFKTDSEQELQVYISNNLEVNNVRDLGEYISLGKLKETEGKQVYNLPKDYEDFRTVILYNETFEVIYSLARLN